MEIVIGLFVAILFWKVWGMTNEVEQINETLTTLKEIALQKNEVEPDSTENT